MKHEKNRLKCVRRRCHCIEIWQHYVWANTEIDFEIKWKFLLSVPSARRCIALITFSSDIFTFFFPFLSIALSFPVFLHHNFSVLFRSSIEKIISHPTSTASRTFAAIKSNDIVACIEIEMHSCFISFEREIICHNFRWERNFHKFIVFKYCSSH